MDAGTISLCLGLLGILGAIVAVVKAFSKVENKQTEFDGKLKELEIQTNTQGDCIIELEKELALHKQELTNYKLYVAQDNKHLYETLVRIQGEFRDGVAELKRDIHEKFDELRKQLKDN